jgi:hypothetical protein
MSFDCNIWMFLFDDHESWTDSSTPLTPPKAWRFFTGPTADAYKRLQIGLVKETRGQPIVSACIASILAIISAFSGLIAFVPQFLELGIQWGPLVRCSASAILAICNIWQPLLFTVFLIPDTPAATITGTKGKAVAWMMATVLLLSSFALLAGYVGSYQMVQVGSPNASIQWLAIEVSLMIIRLGLWSISPQVLRYTSLRIKPNSEVAFVTNAHESWLNEDETKIALLAFGASNESINDFNLAGFRLQEPKIYVARYSNQGIEKYLLSAARPEEETEGLWGQLLTEGDVPIGDVVSIAMPMITGVTVDNCPRVDNLLYGMLSDDNGYAFPPSDFYHLDLIPKVRVWQESKRIWWTSVPFEDFPYHPLSKFNVSIEDIFPYWLDKYRDYKYKQKVDTDYTKSISTEDT